jgi:GNAT superfamily N-acetyltransferase
MTTVGIRPPRPADEAPLAALITEHMSDGSDYTVELGLDDPRLHVLVAEDDDRLLGSMALRVLDTRAAVEDELYLVDSVDPVDSVSRYGLLEMGYVRQDNTGRGVGGRLLERLHERGREAGVEAYLADAWFHGGPDSPEGLFDRYGYRVVHRHSIAGHADGDCPKCGADCSCEAALTVRYDRPDGTGD